MKIIIRQPLYFSEIGRKDNQEDCIYPSAESVSAENRFFVLCDGMGGHENGEVASATVCESLGGYFESHQPEDGVMTSDLFLQALDYAYDELDKKDVGGVKKMGTTMTCLYLHKKGYLVAHIGDSRIYHIRPNTGILYQSSDHSLVNDLLRAGELTEEQAINFPQRNVITRAMQPNLERRHKADIYSFDNVQKGDYFFLCSDGVLEQLTNETLCQILADDNLSDKQKRDAIKEVCDGKTKDNNTCFLIPVDDVIVEADDDSTSDNDDVIIGVESDVEHTSEKEPIPTGKDDAKSTCKWDLSKCNKWVLMVVVLLIFVGSIAAFWPLFHKDKEKPSVKKEQVKKSYVTKKQKKTIRISPQPTKSSVTHHKKKKEAPQKDSSETKHSDKHDKSKRVMKKK